MKYTINNSIVFDSGEGTLRHPDTEDAVQLPLPAQRLLRIILESEYEILGRDFLFQEVWDKYGLTGSNSNLNQYLSLLRRSMMVFGCEHFIITIHKVGIKLDERVSIVRAAGEEKPEESPEPVAVTPLRRKKSFLPRILGGLASLFMIMLASVWFFSTRYTERDPVFFPHTLQSGCIVHTLKSESEYYSEKIEQQVSEILTENKLSCQKNFNVYFDSYTSETPQTYGRVMLALCRSGADGINTSCDNVYYSNRNKAND